MPDKQTYYQCLLCEESQSDADIVQGRVNVIGDKVNLIHSWPKDLCICNGCITLLKEILRKYKSGRGSRDFK